MSTLQELSLEQEQALLDELYTGSSHAAAQKLSSHFVPKIKTYLAQQRPIRCQRKNSIIGYRKQLNDADMETIAHEVMLKFLGKHENFKRDCRLLTWLTGCNLWFVVQSHLRTQKNTPELVSLDEPVGGSEDQQQTARVDLLADERLQEADIERCYEKCWENALLTLHQKDKTYQTCLKALTLHAMGASIEDIAKEIGKTVSATHTFLSTTCKKRILDDENDTLKRCFDDCSHDT